MWVIKHKKYGVYYASTHYDTINHFVCDINNALHINGKREANKILKKLTKNKERFELVER